jgi:hypothetical protein
LTELNVKTAFSKAALTAGTNAHTTYGKKNNSKPKQPAIAAFHILIILTQLTAQLIRDKN